MRLGKIGASLMDEPLVSAEREATLEDEKMEPTLPCDKLVGAVVKGKNVGVVSS